MSRTAAVALACLVALGGCAQIAGFGDHDVGGGEGGAGAASTSASASASASASTSASTGQGGTGSAGCAVDAVCDDQNPCTTDSCDTTSGECANVNVPINTSCGGASLVCNDMGVCVGCTEDAHCPDVPECQIKNCTAAQQCVPDNKPLGDACSAGACDGVGACVQCVDNGDCNAAAGETCDVVTSMCVLSCPDGSKNGLETDVDCGGAVCPKCSESKMCGAGSDCTSNVCNVGVCQFPTCSDTTQNGGESDVDCGNVCAAQKCATGKKCAANNDCASNLCQGGFCFLCNGDGIKNGLEDDIDCGSACAAKCANGKSCNANADCTSNLCSSLKCVPVQCGDIMKNGAETDVDCGGGTCAKCPNGKGCLVNNDCVSNKCQANLCVP